MVRLSATFCVPVLLLLVDITMTQFLPQGYPFPGGQSMPMQYQMPGGMPLQMQMQMPGGIQMSPGSIPMSMQSSKLPVIMMPYHSKSVDEKRKKAFSKKRRNKKQASRNRYESDSEIYDDDDEFIDETRRSRLHGSKRLREHNNHQVLTPVVSYVTKDGYVVYQKKIAKNKPSDWLDVGKKESRRASLEDDVAASLASEELFHRMNSDRHKSHLHHGHHR